MTQNQQLLNADDYKKQVGALRITEEQNGCLWCEKLVFGGLLLLSSIVGLALVLADPAEFTLLLNVTSDYRNGAALVADGLPAINNVSIGTADLGLVAALTSVLGLVAFAFALFVHGSEINQMNGGSNPYIWVNQMFWVPLMMLVLALVSGIHNVYLLTAVALFSWVWIIIFWLDDNANSYEYVYQMKQATWSSAATFAWIPFFFAVFFGVIDFAFVYLYTGFMFAAPAPPSKNLLVISILLGALYLVLVPGTALLFRQRWWVNTIYWREILLYGFCGSLALLTTWVSIFVISAVTP
jgi:hypothetical protein